MKVLKSVEPWALKHEATYIKEALAQYGEKVIVRQQFDVTDLREGRTTRCTDCQDDDPDVADRLSVVYKNAGKTNCLTCFGTGFVGGFRSPSFRTYMLPGDEPEQWVRGDSPGGVGGTMLMEQNRMDVTFSPKPLVGSDDLVVRGTWVNDVMIEEEQRYVIQGPVEKVTLRTGTRQSADQFLLIGQTGTITNLPRDNIFYEVPVI